MCIYNNMTQYKKLFCIVYMQFPDDDIRVIFINSYSNIARIILCEVSIGLLIIVLYRTKPRHLYLS